MAVAAARSVQRISPSGRGDVVPPEAPPPTDAARRATGRPRPFDQTMAHRGASPGRRPVDEPARRSMARRVLWPETMSGERLGVTTVLGEAMGRSFVTALSALAAILTACGSTVSSSTSSAASCRAAGGTCILGGASCAKQAASSAQDCNPPPENPGGAFCCLALQDSGEIADATEVGDAAEASAEAGATDTGAADAPGLVPMNHRADDSQCLTPRGPGTCAPTTGSGLMCTADSQCADGGADGRCTASGGGPAGCSCTYDACQTDSDCGAGQLCVCHGSAYSYGGNACMPGSCRVDSDCGAAGYCSPAHGTTNCGYVSGYYCHTPRDLCVNDSDCSSTSGADVCTWSATDNRWECQAALFCL
jgi:hypothetical protein